jgi:hypothetical protein
MNPSLRVSLLRIPCLTLGALCLLVRGAGAGEVQEIIDLTGFRPSPVPGELIATTIPIHWDSRCMPVPLQINTTLDPVPNPTGPPTLTVAQAAATLQAAADLWNSVPTSFARVKVAGTTSNPGGWGFDMVNEVTFRTAPGFPRQQTTTASIDFGAIAAVRFTRILADSDLTDGLDLDGDGIPDVSATITSCRIVNGHVMLPAGSYKAGTIIDADIIFNTGVSTTGTGPGGFFFTTDRSELGRNPLAVDFFGVAVQTIGSLLGVAHSRTNQRSDEDGRAATMFPFIDTADPADQVAWRSLDNDAVTSISTLYPTPAFQQQFGFITGSITLGSRNEHLLGASVFAVDATTGAIAGTAISGHSQFSVTPNGIGGTFLTPTFHALDGKYTLALPPGSYRVGVEPMRDDRTPMPWNQCNFETQFTHILHQNDFEEQFYTGGEGSGDQQGSGEDGIVRVQAGQTVTGIDIVTDPTVKIANFGAFDHRGFADARPGTYYAVRVPRDQFQSALAAVGAGAVIQAVAFLTVAEDAAVVPRFAGAFLAAGRLRADGTASVELDNALLHREDFVGRDTDFARLEPEDARRLTDSVRAGIAGGTIGDLFLVLRVPRETPFPGFHHAPPEIGLDSGTPAFGLSYSSLDGRIWTPAAGNYLFKLILGPDHGRR